MPTYVRRNDQDEWQNVLAVDIFDGTWPDEVHIQSKYTTVGLPLGMRFWIWRNTQLRRLGLR